MCVGVCVCLTLCLIGLLNVCGCVCVSYIVSNWIFYLFYMLHWWHISKQISFCRTVKYYVILTSLPPPSPHHHHPLTPAPWRTALFLTVTPCSFPAGLLNFSLPTPHPHAKGSLVRHFAPVLVGLLILFSPCPIRLTSRPPPPPPARSPPVLKGSASMSVPCSSGLVLSPHFHPPVSPSYPPSPTPHLCWRVVIPCQYLVPRVWFCPLNLHPPLSPSYPPPPHSPLSPWYSYLGWLPKNKTNKKTENPYVLSVLSPCDSEFSYFMVPPPPPPTYHHVRYSS